MSRGFGLAKTSCQMLCKGLRLQITPRTTYSKPGLLYLRRAALSSVRLRVTTRAMIASMYSLPCRKRRANCAPELDDLLASTRPSKRPCSARSAATTGADVTCHGETSEHAGTGAQETSGWTGKLGALAEHLAERRFAVTKCTLAGCSAKVPRKDGGVLEAECVWRGGECERCGVAFTPGEPRVSAYSSILDNVLSGI